MDLVSARRGLSSTESKLLLADNALAHDCVVGSSYQYTLVSLPYVNDICTTARTTTQWQLRLEIRL